MSRWSESYNNHGFLVVWSELVSLVVDQEFMDKVTPEYQMEYARLRKVIGFLSGVKDSVDPDFFPQNLLQLILQNASAVRDELNAFKSSGNVGHLQNANTHLDSLMTLFCQTPFVSFGVSNEALIKAVNGYAAAYKAGFDEFEAETKSALADFEHRSISIEEGIAKSESDVGRLNSELDTVKQTIQAQSAEFSTQFKTGEEGRDRIFEQLRGDFSKRLDGEFASLAAKAGTAIDVIAKFRSDAEKVMGVIVTTAQAGAYATYAKEEKNSANWLRYSALGFMMIGVGILAGPEVFAIFSKGAEYSFNWQAALGRVPFSAVLFIPAFYLARESTKHRENEIKNRRRELILATIDPYLALLDPEKQQELKAEVARAIFADSDVSGKSGSDPADVVDKITGLVKALKNFGG